MKRATERAGAAFIPKPPRQAETEDDARGFYLTHAYVFALDLGSNAAPGLRDRLIAMGRESPL